jgi:prevent-host-death family protein
MRVIPLIEAKAKLSRYAQLCHDEPVVVTVNGRPSFQLVPLKEDDDLIERLIEDHPGFGKLLERRLSERSGSVRAATRRLKARTSPGISIGTVSKPGPR